MSRPTSVRSRRPRHLGQLFAMGACLAAGLLLFWPARAHAAVYTWNSAGTDGLWTTTTNWTPTAPTNGPGQTDDILLSQSSNNQTITFNGNTRSINSILDSFGTAGQTYFVGSSGNQFNLYSGDITLSGNSNLTIGPSGGGNTTQLQGVDGIFTNTGTGTLTITSLVNQSATAGIAGDMLFMGASQPNGALFKLDNGGNQWTGLTYLAPNVSVTASNGNSFGNNSSGAYVSSGSAITLGDGVNGSPSMGNMFFISGSGIANGGALNLTSVGSAPVLNQAVILMGSSTINVVTGKTLNSNPGSPMFETGVVPGTQYTLTIAGGGTFSVTGGYANINDIINVTGTGTTFQPTSGTMTGRESISLSGTAKFLNGSGAMAFGGVSGVSGTTFTGGNGSMNLLFETTPQTFSGTLGSGTSFALSGDSTLTMSGTGNGSALGMWVNTGNILIATAANSLPTSGSAAMNVNTNGTFELNNGASAINYSANAPTIQASGTGLFVLSGSTYVPSGAIESAGGASNIYSGAILIGQSNISGPVPGYINVATASDTLTLSTALNNNNNANNVLIKIGAGDLKFNGSLSNINHSVIVSAGTLELANNSSFGNGVNIGVASGATLNLDSGSGTNYVFYELVGAGTVTNTSASADTLVIGSNNGGPPISVFSGSITGKLNFMDSNTTSPNYITLSGGANNTYTGTTTVGNSGGNGEFLVVAANNSLGTGTAANNTTVNNGGIGLLNASLTNASQPMTLKGNIFSQTDFTGNLINITGNNSVAGNISLSSNAITIDSASDSLTLSGNISGAVSLTTNGPGAVVLTGTGSNNSGGITLATGAAGGMLGSTLIAANNTSLGGTSGAAVTVNTVASIGVQGGLSGLALNTNTITLNGTGVYNLGALYNVDTGGAPGSNNNTVSARVAFNTNPTFVGTQGAADTLTITGLLSGTNSLTKVGPGTLAIANTWTASTNAQLNVNAGTLMFGTNSISAGSMSSVSASGAFIYGGASLVWNDTAGVVARIPSTPITLNGGTFSLLGNSAGEAIAFGALAANSGTGGVNAYNPGVVNTTKTTFASMAARSAGGGTVNFSDVNSSNTYSINGLGTAATGGSNIIFTSTANIATDGTTGISPVFATVNDSAGINWATYGANGITRYLGNNGFFPGSGSVSTTNYLVTGSGSAVSPSETANALTINSTSSGQSLPINSGATLTLGSGTLAGAGIIYTGANNYDIGNAQGGTLASGRTDHELIVYNFAAANTLTISAVLDNATILTTSGPGTISLPNANASHTGATNVVGGTLSIGNTNSLGSSPGTINVANGGTLKLNGITSFASGTAPAINLNGAGAGGVLNGGTVPTNDYWYGAGLGMTSVGALNYTGNGSSSLSFGGLVTLSTDSVISVPNAGDTLTLSNASFGNNNLTKTGLGILSITNGAGSGNGPSQFINAGTLQVTTGAGLGTGSGTTYVANLATLSFNGSGQTVNKQIVLNGNGASGQSGALVVTGGTNTFSGNIDLATDTTIATVAASDVVNITPSGVYGSGGLTIAGPGTVSLSNLKSGGSIAVNSGATLQFTAGAALGYGSGTVTVNSGGTMNFTSALNNSSIPKSFTLSGSGVGGVGALLDQGGANNYQGLLTLAGNTTISITTGTSTIWGGIADTSGISGGATLTKIGSGTLAIGGGSDTSGTENGVGTSWGGPILVNAGTMQLGSNGGSPLLTGTNSVTLANSATLNIKGAVTLTGLSGPSTTTLTGSDNTNASTLLTLNAGNNTNTNPQTFSGLVNGGIDLNLVGATQLTLTNTNNSAAGHSFVNAGTTLIGQGANTLHLGTVVVEFGGTLEFNGGGDSNSDTFNIAGDGVGGNTGAIFAANTAGGSNTFSIATAPATVNLQGPATINVAGGVNFTVPSIQQSNSTANANGLQGNYGLTKIGTGTLVLGVANNSNSAYTGGTFVNAGTLQLIGTLGSPAIVSVGNSASAGPITATLDVSTASNVNNQGPQLNLSVLTLNSGRITASSATYGSLQLATFGSGHSGVIAAAGTSQIDTIPIYMAAERDIDVASGGTLTISSAIEGQTNNYGLTKTNSGTLVLSGYNSFQGGFALINGTVAIGSSSVAQVIPNGNVTVNVNTITALTSTSGLFVGEPVTGNGLNTGTIITAINSGAGTVTLNQVSNNTATVQAYTFVGGPLGIGTVQIDGGTLQTANATQQLFSNPTVVGQSFGFGNGGAQLTLSGNVSLAGPNGTGLTITSAPGARAAMIGNISGTGALTGVTVAGTGTLTFGGNNTYSGGTVITGTLQATNSTALGTNLVTLSGGKLALQAGYGGLQGKYYNNAPTQSGTTDPDFADLGTMQAHFTTIAATLALTAQSATGGNASLNWSNSAGSNGAAFNNQGFASQTSFEVQYNGKINITTAGNYTFGLQSDDGSMLFLDGANTAVVNDNQFQGWTSNGQPISTTVNLSAGLHTIAIGYYQGGGGDGLNVTYSGPDTGNNSISIPNSVLSTTGLTPAQTFGNNVLVTSTSTIDVSNDLAAAMGTLSINGSTLNVTSADATSTAYSLTLGATTLTGTPTFNVANSSGGGAGTLNLGAIGSSANGIIKTGAGTLALTVAASYTGPTTISAGTVALTLASSTNNIASSSSISVAGSATLNTTGLSGGRIVLGANQTLTGSGTVTGNVSLGANAGSQLTPGTATTIGTLTLNGASAGNLTLTSTNAPTVNFVLGTGNGSAVTTAGSLSSLLAVGGTLTLPTSPGSINLNLIDNSGAGGNGSLGLGRYELFSYSSLSGPSPGDVTSLFHVSALPGPLSGDSAVLTATTSEIDITILPPVTWTGNGSSSWDTTTPNNWARGTSDHMFANGDNVIIQDLNTVTSSNVTQTSIVVQTGGVTPGAVSFTNSAVNYTLSNQGGDTVGIAGSTGLTKTGAGIVTLNGQNSYTGTTSVSNGTLRTGVSGAIPSGSLLVLSGGSVDLNGVASTTVAGLSDGGSASGTLGSSASPGPTAIGLTITQPAGTTTFSGTINENITAGGNTGSGNTLTLTVNGTGTESLSGTNTFSGGTNVNGGTLRFTSGALGTVGNIAFGGGTLQYSSSPANTLDISARVFNSAGAISIDTNSNTVSFATALDSSNVGGLAKLGGGTLSLDAAAGNNYGGNTTVSGGTLRVTNTSNSATGSGTVAVNASGTLSGTGIITGAVTVNGSILGASGSQLTLSGGLILQGGSSSTFTLGTPNNTSSALITTSSGGNSLVVNGTHTVNLAGSPQLGTYDLFDYTGAAPTFSNFTLGTQPSGFTYQLVNGSNQIDVNVIQVDTWTGQTSGNGATDSSWNTTGSTNWANNGLAVTYSDAVGVVFQDANAANGNVNVTSTSVVVQGAGVNPVSVLMTNSAVNYTFSDASGTTGISGSARVTKTGTGTVTFNGANTYSGGTTITGGTVVMGVGSTGAITNGPLGTGSVTLGSTSGSNNTSLLFGTTAGLTLANSITVQTTSGNGTVTIGGQNTTGTNTYSGNITLGNGTNTGRNIQVTAAAGGTLSFTGNILANGSDTSSTVTINGGTVQLSGASTYAGGTAIQTGTVLLAASSTGAGPITSGPLGTSAVSVVASAGGSNLETNGAFTIANPISTSGTGGSTIGTTITSGSSTFSGNITLNNNSNLLLGAAGGGTVTFSGNIGQNGASGFSTGTIGGGNGTVVLAGQSTFSGSPGPISGTLGIGSSSITTAGGITSGPLGVGTLNLTLASGGYTVQNDGTTRSVANAVNLSQSLTLQSTTPGSSLNFDPGSLTTPNNFTISGTPTITVLNNVAINDPLGVSASTVTRNGSGTLTLNGASGTNFTGVLSMSGGVTQMTSPTATLNMGSVNPDFNIGLGSNATAAAFNISAGTLTVGRITLDDNASGVNDNTRLMSGAMTQSGGIVTSNSWLAVGSGFQTNTAPANANGGYGAYNLSGGTLNVNTVGAGAAADLQLGLGQNAGGTFNLSGTGILNLNTGSNMALGDNGNSSAGITGGGNSSVFTVYQSGGTVNFNGTSTTAGGSLNGLGPGNRGELILGNSRTGNNGATTAAQGIYTYVLAGGTLNVPQIQQLSAAGATSNFVFNGGTLKPISGQGTNTTYMQGLSNAFVESNGAVIDTNGQSITIGQALLAPTGNGLLTIPVTGGGSGYVIPPSVIIGSGTSGGPSNALQATAYANVSGGAVTSITISFPGVGYTGAPSVSLSGGGGSGALLGTPTFGANVSGGLTVSGTGGGTLTLTGANTYTGTTLINAGGSLALVAASTNNIANSSVINVGGSATNATLNVAGLTGSPAGTLVLANAQTLKGNGTVTGTVNVASGTHLDPGNSVGTLTVGSLTLSSGSILDYEFNANPANDLTKVTTSGGLTLNGGAVNLYQEGTTNPFNTPGTYQLIGYSGAIGGTGTVAMSVNNPQPNTLYTFGTDTVLGNNFVDLIITPTTLTWNGAANSGTGTWDVNTTANWNNNTTNFTNGKLVVFDDTPTGSPPFVVTVAAGGVQPGSVTFNNSTSTYMLNSNDATGIFGAGTAGTMITKNDAGQVILAGANTFTGNVQINAGRITVENSAALGASNTTTVAGTGAALELQGSVALGSSNSLSLNGTGISSGGALNSVSGANSVAGGITLAGAATIASSSAAMGDGLTLSGGVNNAGHLLSISGPGNVTVMTAGISGGGGLTYSGSGVLALNVANSYGGTTTVSGGSLRVGAPGALPATLLVLQSPGQVDLNGQSTTTVAGLSDGSSAGGTIGSSSTGQAVGLTVTQPGGTTTFSGTISDNLTVGATVGSGNTLSLTVNGTGTEALSAANTYSGGTNANGGTLDVTSTGSLRSGSALSVGASGKASIDYTNPNFGAVSNANTATNSLNFTANSGTATLSSLSGSGNTNFASNANVGGTFSAGTATVAGTGTFATVSGGTLNLNGATSSITTLNGGTINLASTVLTVSNGSTSGSITGAGGSLVKGGSSSDTLVLNSGNTYGGGTMVNVGTVQVGNSMGTSATGGGSVRVQTGGVLGGGGFIGGPVSTVSSGSTSSTNGHIAPGVGGSATKLTINNTLSLDVNSYLGFILNTPNSAPGAGGNDLISVLGTTLTINQGLTLNITPGVNFGVGTYPLITYTGSLTDSSSMFTGWTATGTNGLGYNFALGANEIDLVVHAGVGSATWNVNANGNYSAFTNWYPQQIPNGAGQTATFGNGQTVPVTAANVQVTVDGAFTVGTLLFNNTNGTQYTLISGGGGDGITLDSGNSSGAHVTVTSGSHEITTNLTLADSGGTFFNVAGGSTLTMDTGSVIGEMGGSRGITKQGDGTLVMLGTNTYTGPSLLNGGTTTITNEQSLGNGGTVTINAATLDAAPPSGGGNFVSNRSYVLGDVASTINVAAFRTFEITTALTGSGGSLTVTGSGTPSTLLLDGANTYGGATTVNTPATLEINTAGSLPSGTNLAVNGNLTLDNASQSVASLSDNGGSTGLITLNGASGTTLTVTGGTTTYTGVITGSGSLVKNGSGSLALSGPNDFVGSVSVSSGTLIASGNGTLGASNNTLDVSGTGTFAKSDGGSLTLGTPAGAGAVTLDTGSTLEVNSGTLELDAAPTLNTTNTLQVNGGTLRFKVMTGAPTIGSGVTATVASGATLELAGSVSALSSGPGHRVDIINNSPAISGGMLLVSGTNQAVGTITGTGDTVVNDGSDLTANQIQQNALSVGSAALSGAASKVTIRQSGTGGVVNNTAYSGTLTSLTIANDGAALGTRTYRGTLDINNNGIVMPYNAGPNPYANVADMVRAGYASGFTGTGLISTTAATNQGLNIAVADNAQLVTPFTTFEGQTVGLTTVLVRMTYNDDLQLTGNVTQNDAIIFGSNYDNGAASNHTWAQGDINHDGKIDQNDAILFGTFYDPTLPQLDGNMGGPALAGLLGGSSGSQLQFTSALGGGSLSAVPEPSTFVLLGLGGLAGLLAFARRRRQV